MKHDPHKNPIKLTGEWTWKLTNKHLQPLVGSFWYVSSRLMLFRKANRMERAGFEQCQLDILVARRKELGLTTELAEVNPPPVLSRNKQYINRLAKKAKGGCRSCGRK